MPTTNNGSIVTANKRFRRAPSEAMVFDELPPKKNERRRICRRLEICIFVIVSSRGFGRPRSTRPYTRAGNSQRLVKVHFPPPFPCTFTPSNFNYRRGLSVHDVEFYYTSVTFRNGYFVHRYERKTRILHDHPPRCVHRELSGELFVIAKAELFRNCEHDYCLSAFERESYSNSPLTNRR